jgi:S-adenosylmethionine:tRNA ribosyltransferase-isomerase
MSSSDFDYPLPERLIAQHPLANRDESRLLVCRRTTGATEHRQFSDLTHYLRAGDVLVVNNSRVIPARMHGMKAGAGAKVEILLLEEKAPNQWMVLLKPAKRVHPGAKLQFGSPDGACSIEAELLEKLEDGRCRLQFQKDKPLMALLDVLGSIPLPPYIHRAPSKGDLNDWERYQTVYAAIAGSVAAPTAGLHFTESLLTAIRTMGVEICEVTLHVGPGTFAPVKTESPEDHKMHSEVFQIGQSAAGAINRAKTEGRRVLAVGTTSVRVLESAAAMSQGPLEPTKGETRLFVRPPYGFRIVDGMVTNFHLPKSTLLMLVSAFASPGTVNGREMVLKWYREAIAEGYRFFSYGDAMFVF